MKQVEELSTPIGKGVAPYVGAWIETNDKGYLISKDNVAPYVGAWIETIIYGF